MYELKLDYVSPWDVQKKGSFTHPSMPAEVPLWQVPGFSWSFCQIQRNKLEYYMDMYITYIHIHELYTYTCNYPVYNPIYNIIKLDHKR